MLKILAIVLVASVLLGWTTRGRIGDLAHVSLRWTALLYASVVMGLAPLLLSIGHSASRALVTCGYILLMFFLVMNAMRLRGSLRIGLAVLCLGWVLNATPFIANGGMPLSLWAYARSGIRESPTPSRGGFFKIIIATSASKLKFLGDVIPVNVIREVVSLGDLTLGLGVGIIIVAGMHTPGEANAQ